MTTVPSHRILITCSRKWGDWITMRGVMSGLHQHMPGALLIHGDARRGDRDIANYWTSLGGATLPVPADWDACGPECDPRHRRKRRWDRTGGTYCPDAGYRRNQLMVDMQPRADLCVAFIRDSSTGATDCATRAELAGITLRVYSLEQVV